MQRGYRKSQNEANKLYRDEHLLLSFYFVNFFFSISCSGFSSSCGFPDVQIQMYIFQTLPLAYRMRIIFWKLNKNLVNQLLKL